MELLGTDNVRNPWRKHLSDLGRWKGQRTGKSGGQSGLPKNKDRIGFQLGFRE